jgi:predicted nucleotidyltransferase
MKPRSSTPEDLESTLSLIVERLAQLDGVRRIWLFGSLAKGRVPDWRSDIDIAVEGLESTALGGVWSDVDRLIAPPLDLVRYEETSAPLRSEIEQCGRLLYVAA